MRSGERIATGTGPNRRRLTEAEAEAGGLPDRFTPEEWEAMRLAATLPVKPVRVLEEELHRATTDEVGRIIHAALHRGN